MHEWVWNETKGNRVLRTQLAKDSGKRPQSFNKDAFADYVRLKRLALALALTTDGSFSRQPSRAFRKKIIDARSPASILSISLSPILVAAP